MSASMQLIINLFTIFVLTWLATYYIVEKLESKSKTKSKYKTLYKSLVPAVVACLAFLITSVTYWFGGYLNKPDVKIETKRNESEINIKITASKGSIVSMALNYPVVGYIENLQEFNSITAVHTTVARAIGGGPPDVMNTLQLRMEDINPEPEMGLNYTIFYKHSEMSHVGGDDRYQFSYSWKYKDEIKHISEWRLVENDKLTGPSIIQTGTARMYPKILSKEELDKISREGPEIRNLR